MTPEVTVLTANIDDMPGEAFGYLLERLMGAGALDVSLLPMTMKKSRPGVMVQVVSRVEDEERMGRLLLAESSTLGVRLARMRRMVQERAFVRVETPDGPIDMKVARDTGRACPEYEQAAALAREAGVPYLAVYEAAMHAYQERKKEV